MTYLQVLFMYVVCVLCFVFHFSSIFNLCNHFGVVKIRFCATNSNLRCIKLWNLQAIYALIIEYSSHKYSLFEFVQMEIQMICRYLFCHLRYIFPIKMLIEDPSKSEKKKANFSSDVWKMTWIDWIDFWTNSEQEFARYS